MEIFNYIQSRAKNEIEPVMEEIIPRDGKPEEVYKLIWDFLDRGGKRFRPVLTVLSCEAVGGNKKEALYPAVAIELFHNFTLIHDDIEDNSQMRRGKPCLHVEYGVPLAINAGDGLYNFVWNALLNADIPDDKKIKTGKILSNAYLEVLKGQATEIGWEHNDVFDITEDDYIKMIGGKTGALIGASCETGAYIGGADEKTVKVFREFGQAIGLSFQIQDDILNITGDFEKYKKEILGDLTEGKRTLMIIKTLERATPDEKELIINTLKEHTDDNDKLNKIVALMKKYGAIDYAKQKAYGIIKNAKEELINNTDDNDARNKLLEIADFFLTREL
ncbi:polyprenyl synthetase family protein [Candidatus Micrarchaeota archaeon]|nr:polyprenyl synthetase family protein [Candidatus Micrarchaeota archaeon]